MTVSTESLNKAVGQVSGNVSTTTDQARSELIDLSTAARATNFQGTAGEVLAGIEAVASVASTSVPLATLTESIPGLSQELIQQIDPGLMAGLNALEGTSSSAGTASEAFLHEVITTGTPQAINSALNELTGKSPNQLNRILRDIAPNDVKDLILDGLKEFDDGKVITGNKTEKTLDTIKNILGQAIPNISVAVIDNIAIDLDPDTQKILQDVLNTNRIQNDIKVSILEKVYRKQFQAAAEVVRSQNGEMSDLDAIVNELLKIELNPSKMIGDAQDMSTIKEVDHSYKSFGAGNHRFEFVDTAEEFEAIIASSARPINTFVTYSTGTTIDVDAKFINQIHTDAGFDGIQYHFIIRRDGRVQMGRPLNTAGSSVSGSDVDRIVSIAFIGNSEINVAQGKSYREMMKAVYRIIPGASVVEAAALANVDKRDPSAPPPTGFSPETVNSCVFGASGGTSTIPGQGLEAIQGEPGLETALQADLINILTQAANNTAGVSGLQTTSGIIGRTNSIGSGRHYEGWASDTAILTGSDNRRCSVTVSEDLTIIQNFTQNFINIARSSGYRPSVGMANPALPQHLYMKGTSFHYDIAAGMTTAKVVRAAIWRHDEGAERSPPSWLMKMYY